jgi:hypothetical protein
MHALLDADDVVLEQNVIHRERMQLTSPGASLSSQFEQDFVLSFGSLDNFLDFPGSSSTSPFDG